MAEAGQIWGTVMCPDDAFLAKAEPEPALDPERPIVDTHLHLWHHFPRHPYFLPEHVRDMEEGGHNVVASVYVECGAFHRAFAPEHLRPVGEVEYAAGQAAMAESGQYTNTRVAQAIIGFADLRLGERTRELLEAQIKAGGGRFRGVRQRAKWDADPVVKGKWSEDQPHLYTHPDFDRGLKDLTALGLCFEASIYHPQLPDVVAMARANPDTTIIVNHTASPVGHSSYKGREDENYAAWLAGIRELADCPNVVMKLGGILMNVANYDFTDAERPIGSSELSELWRPWYEPCVELLGAGRCAVSANFPVDKIAYRYGTVWNTFKRIFAGCSEEEKRLVFSDTARRVYRLD